MSILADFTHTRKKRWILDEFLQVLDQQKKFTSLLGPFKPHFKPPL